MISENLVQAIEREGRKNNFHIHSAGGEREENGEVIFVIKLKYDGPEKRVPSRHLPNFLQAYRKRIDSRVKKYADFLRSQVKDSFLYGNQIDTDNPDEVIVAAYFLAQSEEFEKSIKYNNDCAWKTLNPDKYKQG